MLARKIKGIHIFRDADAIPYGLDFEAILRDEVARCDVFVAVIGPQWLTVTDDEGRRMLDRPVDFVRLEIELAQARGVPIVVALVDGALFPALTELPASLNALVGCPCVDVASEVGVESLCRARGCASGTGSSARHSRTIGSRDLVSLAVRGPLRYRRRPGRGYRWCCDATDGPAVFAGGLWVGPIVDFSVLGGSITGHRVGGRMGALAGAMIMPLVTTLLLAVMSFLGAAPALVGHAVLSGERGATGSGQILASLLGCSAGIAGMLRVLRGILRQRLQRIRVWNATVRVVAGSITGVAVGTGLVLVLVAALPPDKWPRSYSLLVEAATLFISGGTAGLVDGAVAGWLVKEIGA